MCSGIDTNSLMKCNRTVVDIFSDISLCSEHLSETTPTAAVKRKGTHLQPRAASKKVKVGVAKAIQKKGMVKVRMVTGILA